MTNNRVVVAAAAVYDVVTRAGITPIHLLLFLMSFFALKRSGRVKFIQAALGRMFGSFIGLFCKVLLVQPER